MIIYDEIIIVYENFSDILYSFLDGFNKDYKGEGICGLVRRNTCIMI